MLEIKFIDEDREIAEMLEGLAREYLKKLSPKIRMDLLEEKAPELVEAAKKDGMFALVKTTSAPGERRTPSENIVVYLTLKEIVEGAVRNAHNNHRYYKEKDIQIRQEYPEFVR
jgi:hypothetical protein